MKRAIPALMLLLAVTRPTSALADPVAIAPATATPVAAPLAPASPCTRTTVALISAGIAVAAAGTAAVFGALALQNKSDFKSSATYGHADDGNDDAAYADGAIALAVAAGVTSLVLFLTHDGPAHSPSPLLSASPFVTPHGGGAGAVVRF